MTFLLALALAAAPTPLPEIGEILPVCRESLRNVLRGDKNWLPRYLAGIKASKEAQERYFVICGIHHKGAVDLSGIEAEGPTI